MDTGVSAEDPREKMPKERRLPLTLVNCPLASGTKFYFIFYFFSLSFLLSKALFLALRTSAPHQLRPHELPPAWWLAIASIAPNLWLSAGQNRIFYRNPPCAPFSICGSHHYCIRPCNKPESDDAKSSPRERRSFECLVSNSGPNKTRANKVNCPKLSLCGTRSLSIPHYPVCAEPSSRQAHGALTARPPVEWRLNYRLSNLKSDLGNV